MLLRSNAFSILEYLMHDEFAYSRYVYSLVYFSCFEVVFHINSVSSLHICYRLKRPSQKLLLERILFKQALNLMKVFRNHVHEEVYNALKYEWINSLLWYVFELYYAFINVWLQNFNFFDYWCHMHEAFDPSQGNLSCLKKIMMMPINWSCKVSMVT